MTEGKLLFAFLLGFAASAFTAAAAFLLYLTAKKKSDGIGDGGSQNASGSQSGGASQSGEKSETRRDAEPPRTKAAHLIHLTSLRQPDRKWLEPVSDALLIGRHEACPVRLDDLSVSSYQCRITETAEGPAAVNLSKTNETLVDGASAGEGRRLFPGAVLTLGREQLRVDYICGADDGESGVTSVWESKNTPADAFDAPSEERFW